MANEEFYTVGYDDKGRQYVLVEGDVYRIGANGLGTWISKLNPFLATGVSRYRVTVDYTPQSYKL